MTKSIFTGEIHPVADLFPMLGEEELDELAADIAERGLLQPIVIDKDGRLIDGRNRLEACRRAGVEPEFDVYTGDDPAGYALAVNIARRHLSKGQIAMVEAKARLLNNRSVHEAADESGVSKARIVQASVVLQYAPELADLVVSGSQPLNEAYKEAQARKAAALSIEAQIAKLREEAPDLADLVAEERLTLAAARAELEERAKAQRERIRINSVELARCVSYAAQVLAFEEGRAALVSLFSNAESGNPFKVTKTAIRAAAESLGKLGKEWPGDEI